MHLTDAAVLQGEICDIDGKCVDAAEDELFKLTTKEGKIAVEREVRDTYYDGQLSMLQTCILEQTQSILEQTQSKACSSVVKDPSVTSLTLACPQSSAARQQWQSGACHSPVAVAVMYHSS